MFRTLATALPTFLLGFISLAHAVEEEQPVETSNTGVVVFVVAVVVCVIAFGWYMYRNEKKPEEEKLGDKF